MSKLPFSPVRLLCTGQIPTGCAHKDLPPLLVVWERTGSQRLNRGSWGKWDRLILWQNHSYLFDLAVKGSFYTVFMPLQPRGGFCPSDQMKGLLSAWSAAEFPVGHPRAEAWPQQVLMVTDLHRVSLALKLLQKLLIIPADAPHRYWWWRCRNCSQNCVLGDAWTSLKNVEVAAVGAQFAARSENRRWHR